MIVDLVNASFECVAAVLMWLNVVRIRRDKCVRGVSIASSTFTTIWATWSLVYYPALGQWLSAGAACVILTARVVWLLEWYRLTYWCTRT